MTLDSFRRAKTKKKYILSPKIKLFLLIAVILGIYARSCYFKSKEKLIIINNISYEANLPAGCDIKFDLTNKTSRSGYEKIFITVYDQNNDPIATKLSKIYLHPNKTKRYLEIITLFNRNIQKDDFISDIKIKLYRPSFLKRNI